MKQQILDIIKNKPKHYTVIIKKDSDLMEWINLNTLSNSDDFRVRMYSAVFQEPSVCENNNERKISRWNKGWVNCGPANICSCTKHQLSESVQKAKQSLLPPEHKRINEKRNRTMLKKYGVKYNSQRDEVKEILSKPKIPINIYNKLTDKSWLKNEYVTNNRSAVDIAAELKVYYSTVIEYCRSHGFKIKQRSNYSIIEQEIAEYIRMLGFDVITNNRDILQNKEIDIYVPSLKLGIEVNGLYWHSYHPSRYNVEDKHRHLRKTIEANSVGVSLFHITDYEWNQKNSIMKSILSSKLGCNKTIYARKTTIKDIPVKEAKQFFETNHIQGFVSSIYYIGLYHEAELQMAISAGRNRFTEDSTIELYRMATVAGVTVSGGSSKLVKELKKRTDLDIISYCDRSKFSGSGYKEIGFELVNETGPGFFWTDGNNVVSRFKAQKHNLEKWLHSYNGSISQSENMFAAKYMRYWDCGNYVFRL